MDEFEEKKLEEYDEIFDFIEDNHYDWDNTHYFVVVLEMTNKNLLP